jgi:site-specific DNA recombinase
MFGRTYKARARQPERRYYCCHGKDCIVSARESVCPARLVKAAELEAAVWEHVVGLLGDPAQLAAQFTRCVTAGEEDDAAHAADEQLASRRRRLERQEARLLDAYQAEVIDLAELAARRRQLEQQRDVLERQRAEQQRRRQRHRRAQEVLSSLAAFTDRIQARLQAASLADRRAILELVIDRIIVHAGTGNLEIRHVIPDSPDGLAFGQPRAPTSAGEPRPYARSGGRVLTDATGESGNPRLHQRFRGFWARRPDPNGESGLRRGDSFTPTN